MFADVCDTLEAALAGPFRAAVVQPVVLLAHARGRPGAAARGDACRRLELRRRAAHPGRWPSASTTGATRSEGFHALHDWDGVAAHVNPDTIPVDVLDYIAGQRGGDAFDPVAPAILIDYYFMHVLSLLSLRVWDEGDADANLDRVRHAAAAAAGPGRQRPAVLRAMPRRCC